MNPLSKLFQKKKQPIAPIQRVHAETCNCRKCMGLDSLYSELAEVRQQVRQSNVQHKFIDNHDRVINRVAHRGRPGIPTVVDAKELELIQDKGRKNYKVGRIADMYLRKLGMIE
jgi:phosphopentomutase